MASQLSAEQFINGFLGLQNREETKLVDLGGDHPLPVRAWPSPGAKSLVILFHGAVNRQTREYPQFLAYRPGIHPHAHQIAIADPSLALSDRMSTGWFAGSHGTPLQRLIPPFLSALIERLQVDKIIFTGGSAGGFAALYYSWLFPGSAAVVTVPQTNIHKYREHHRRIYLQASWPEGADTGSDSDSACLDLRDIYSQGMRNTVVYLQSNMDSFHVKNQMAPLLSSLPTSAVDRFILKCSFWGTFGHSGSVPTREMNAWIRAALSAEELTSESIILAYELANQTEPPALTQRQNAGDRSATKAGPNEPDRIDQQWTAKIAAEMLA